MVNPKKKGARGEREAGEWLRDNLDLSYKPQRILDQVREGGHDLGLGEREGEPIIAVEVKRRESLSLNEWWYQVICAVDGTALMPVVMYRKNAQAWSFLVSAQEIGLERGFVLLDEKVFVQWYKMKVFVTDR